MPQIGIEIEGIESLEDMLKEVGSLRPFKSGLKAGAYHLKGKIAKYPPVSRRPQPFVSDKQRRGFFAKLSSGEIEVPYRRGISPNSERYAHSWTVAGRNEDLEQVVGNDTSYGPLLQDENKQTAYHKGTGWKTIQDIAEEMKKEIATVVLAAMNKAIARIKGQ